MLSAGKSKCRLPQHSGVSVDFQSDAFFSGSQTKSEQAQNKPSDCKTELRPVRKENAAAAETRNGAIDQESRREDASTALAARHPIIATHWGIAA